MTTNAYLTTRTKHLAPRPPKHDASPRYVIQTLTLQHVIVDINNAGSCTTVLIFSCCTTICFIQDYEEFGD